MVGNINTNIQQYNYITTSGIKNNPEEFVDKKIKLNTQNSYQSTAVFGKNDCNISPVRTNLNGKDEINKYSFLLSYVDKKQRKELEGLLNSGILLNCDSNDKSTVLDNLFKIATQKRANGLESKNILDCTIDTLSNPYTITQKFGDIPRGYRETAKQLFNYSKMSPNDRNERPEDIDVKYSSTCVAASLEFKLAKQMPAEFTRYVQELSSPSLSVQKNLNLKNLADHVIDRLTLLDMFKTQVNNINFNNAQIVITPDNNAILRAIIQTKHRDGNERSPIDVLLQSAFMNLGSQRTYNSLTDKRGGVFNQEDTGLNEFEKTYAESVIFGKNIISVVYQDTVADENNTGIKLAGYKIDFNTIKRQLLETLDNGDNIIIGCTNINKNDYIEGGHELTVVGYKKDPATGKIYFICNDTDDYISKPIIKSEEQLIPAIHHAALPKEIAEKDYEVEPSGDETIKKFRQNRN